MCCCRSSACRCRWGRSPTGGWRCEHNQIAVDRLDGCDQQARHLRHRRRRHLSRQAEADPDRLRRSRHRRALGLCAGPSRDAAALRVFDDVGRADRLIQRSLRKKARTSSTNSSGCSKAAKWPPLGISLQCWMLVKFGVHPAPHRRARSPWETPRRRSARRPCGRCGARRRSSPSRAGPRRRRSPSPSRASRCRAARRGRGCSRDGRRSRSRPRTSPGSTPPGRPANRSGHSPGSAAGSTAAWNSRNPSRRSA